MRTALPKVERLKELFVIDRETGDLVWAKQCGTVRRGAVAGAINADGYRRASVDGQLFMVHRLVWKILSGEEPPETLDHWDGNTLNNRFENLRTATASGNALNSKVRKDNKTNVKGVCFERQSGKWRAYLYVLGKQIRLGRFATEAQATKAVTEARLKTHSEFGRDF